MKLRFLFWLCALSMPATSACAQPPIVPPQMQQPQGFSREMPTTFRGRYLVSYPKGFKAGSTERWPMIVYLHGESGRGRDLDKLKEQGLTNLVENGRELPFFVVSPQCPPNESWESRWMTETVNAVLTDVQEKYPIDAERIYLTGWSMGASGVWSFAQAHGDRLAAIAPLAGKGDATRIDRMAIIPSWIFHGADDKTVAPEESQKMFDALKAVKRDTELTLLEKQGHEIWPSVYGNPALYDWFLKHTRVKPKPAEAKPAEAPH